MRFLNWWFHGYNNGFGCDTEFGAGRASVGLGGSIGRSMDEFIHSHGLTAETSFGNRATSGNGSIMRLAPLPVFAGDDLEVAQEIAYKQSKTTHQGDEAAHCARLLAYICARAIRWPSDEPRGLDQLIDGFDPGIYSVGCLALGECEDPNQAKASGHRASDRKWNWRKSHYKYCKSRAKMQPDYVGSYSMDCMAMALHCVYSTNSFMSAMLKSVNLGGGADTVSAVVGQIAGALYGATGIPQDWIDAVLKWDPKGDIPLRIFKLNHKLPL